MSDVDLLEDLPILGWEWSLGVVILSSLCRSDSSCVQEAGDQKGREHGIRPVPLVSAGWDSFSGCVWQGVNGL